MPKKSDRKLIPVCIKLFEGDKEILSQFYPGVGYNIIIRSQVDKLCKKLLEQESRKGILNAGTDPDLGFDLDAIGDGQTG